MNHIFEKIQTKITALVGVDGDSVPYPPDHKSLFINCYCNDSDILTNKTNHEILEKVRLYLCIVLDLLSQTDTLDNDFIVITFYSSRQTPDGNPLRIYRYIIKTIYVHNSPHPTTLSYFLSCEHTENTGIDSLNELLITPPEK